MITNIQNVLIGQPQFYVTHYNISEFCNFQWKLNQMSGKKVVAKMIRGGKCTTINGLFDEFSAVFQFPYYFGENWDAFDECLNDLEWIKADAFVLCICNAEDLLHLANEDFKVFAKILLNTAEEWENGRDLGAISTPPTPFKVVFQCGEGKKMDVITTFHALGIGLEKL
ncbi:barstar family protein [Paenibacillus sp. FSL R7-0048]|uniref:barstar family protein n=1 Tax=Paenibacillus TaxID=44249 RepID=UPI00096D391D|nr:barstar family protein [Paenibacillus odorifer]OMD58213.1 hypothetical protein BSK48_30640 [Paenibacillus odorifer]